MGLGYVETMKGNEEEGNIYDGEEEAGVERPWYNSPHAILSIAAAIFLFALGHLEMLTNDPELPEQKVQMKRSLRVYLYFAMSVFLIGIQFLNESAETYVPLVIVGTGLIMIWGTRLETSST
eukprot:CAMPEP_0196206744 /NCGR_PEP_ID=MMETSP0912-20130531/7998_1 /TAXON_ID=49265 /ORGANISM="Thalassiosira rotula, Strain GSO102" /LENGTH=121 /DNA_ID=CAMNT_0041481329 /DNA_START=30 /DNA_END=395 /DNA_ORIENTATION=+